MKTDKNTILAIKQYMNNLQGDEIMNDYLIPLIIDERMDTFVDIHNSEGYEIKDTEDDDDCVSDFNEFVHEYTQEFLKVMIDVLTSFEDDDIIDLVGMQGED